MKNTKLVFMLILAFIVGAGTMALIDANLKKPLFSRANSSYGDIVDEAGCWDYLFTKGDLYASQTVGHAAYVESIEYDKQEAGFVTCMRNALSGY